jgi:hypothetical protein
MISDRKPRGAAVVETALGITVLVTVLLFGVHFGEVMWVAQKTQEAAAAAKWDATSMRVRRLPGDYGPADHVAANTAALTQDRYEDFDGRSSVEKRASLAHVTTAANNLDVECELATDLRFPRRPLPPRLAAVYQDIGGIRCSASADVWLTRIPHAFGEGGGGLFAAKHVAGKDRYHACSFGNPFAANCAKGPSLMLGDWGLAGFDEGIECYLAMGDECPNQAYYLSANKAYDVGGKAKGQAAMTLARAIVGTAPIDANQFWFSFRGEESEFLECVPPTGGEGPNKWETNPGLNSPVAEYNDGYLNRGNCAMGWPADATGKCPTRGW